MRPVILNGIDDIANRNDLADRSLVVNLPRIPEKNRMLEKDLWKDFESAKPRILGAFLDAVSFGLSNAGKVSLKSIPRMADFANWVAAAEPKLVGENGMFLKAYEENREDSVLSCFESDNVAIVFKDFIELHKKWEGTAAELKKALEEHARVCMQDLNITNDKSWPKMPNYLSNRVRRIAPALRKAGINVSDPSEDGRTRGKRSWRFTCSGV
jgi:hypothetical protein